MPRLSPRRSCFSRTEWDGVKWPDSGPPSLPTLKKNADASVTLYFGNPSCIVLARGVSIAGAGNARRRRGATFSTGYLSGQGE